ncbi:MAG: hypothetical protein ACR2PH_05555 [Desulfobulbia bacterium]
MTKDEFTKKYSVGDWVYEPKYETYSYILKIGKKNVKYFHPDTNELIKLAFETFYIPDEIILCNQPINEGLDCIKENDNPPEVTQDIMTDFKNRFIVDEPIDPRIEKRLAKIEKLLSMNELEKEVVELISYDLRNATGVLTGDGNEFEYSYPWDEQTWFKQWTRDLERWDTTKGGWIKIIGLPVDLEVLRRKRA